MSTPARRLTIADAMIACAAVGVWFAIARASPPVEPFPPPMAARLRLVAMVLAALGTSTAALLAMRLLPPRPPLRELASRPGFAACQAATLACAGAGLAALGYWASAGWEWNPAGLLESFAHFPAFAVAGAWLVLAQGGHWRSTPRDWREHAGRVVGWLWIACPAAFWVAFYFIIFFT